MSDTPPLASSHARQQWVGRGVSDQGGRECSICITSGLPEMRVRRIRGWNRHPYPPLPGLTAGFLAMLTMHNSGAFSAPL